MNTFKKGVKLYGTRSEMNDIHNTVCSWFNKHQYTCVVIKAMQEPDGKTLHGIGLARDYLTKHVTQHHIKHLIADELMQALPMCDVALKHEGKHNEHLTIIFNDKRDKAFQKNKNLYELTGRWPGG